MIRYRNAYPNELYHYGVKGQKWYRRRYQNYDGSLTKAGKAHYSSVLSKKYNEFWEGKRMDVTAPEVEVHDVEYYKKT